MVHTKAIMLHISILRSALQLNAMLQLQVDRLIHAFISLNEVSALGSKTHLADKIVMKKLVNDNEKSKKITSV